MTRFALIVIILVLVMAAYADHRPVIVGPGYQAPRTYGSRSGFGNVAFPGTGAPPPVGAITSPGFASSLGGIVGGYGPYTGAPVGPYHGRPYRPAYVPVAYPVYVGGYYPEYPPQYPQQPANVTIINQAPPPPQVIINNQTESAKPVVREYGPDSWKDSGVTVYHAPTAVSEAPQGEVRATVYLVAFQDGTIYPAIAMWLDDDTLHYITKDGKPNKASLALVDREFSERLNRERGLDFPLPAFQ